VRVLELGRYAGTGAMVAFDVKAMRTQRAEVATRHLANSRKIFLHLVEKARTFDGNIERECIASRDYEALEMAILEHLMGV
jgi:xylose isomerase